MAKQQGAPKDPTFDEVIADRKNWSDEVRLADLNAYIFESDAGEKKIAVTPSFVLAHGTGEEKRTTTPRTLGELRQGFADHNAFEDPGGIHNRSQIVLRYQDPSTGKERTDRLPVAMIYVKR